MPKMIQIRNVPDDIHMRLKIRAAREGLSLSDMLLREATRVANTPTIDEISERIRERVRRRGDVPDLSAAQLVQMIREGRER